MGKKYQVPFDVKTGELKTYVPYVPPGSNPEHIMRDPIEFKETMTFRYISVNRGCASMYLTGSDGRHWRLFGSNIDEAVRLMSRGVFTATFLTVKKSSSFGLDIKEA